MLLHVVVANPYLYPQVYLYPCSVQNTSWWGQFFGCELEWVEEMGLGAYLISYAQT
jgi:hypothetical protein